MGIALYFLFDHKLEKKRETIVITSINSADKLLEGGMFEDAMAIYNGVLKKISIKDQPQLYGHVKAQQGLCYHKISASIISNREENLAMAISLYKEALKIFMPKKYPQEYAMSQGRLGNAYTRLADVRNREENVTKAIQAYEQALKIYTIEKYPIDYAATQNNLGTAYEILADVRNREENVTKAIQAYEQALKIYTIEKYPIDYAATQNNLGTAYEILADVRNREENLTKAIQAYEQALKIITVKKYPLYHKKVLSNLKITKGLMKE